MEIAICMIIGYMLGTLSPAALVSKIKKKDLRKYGTKNLGATNTLLNFGKIWGALVMIFDIAKSFAAYKLAQYLFPEFGLAGLVAGCAAIAGHIFPFYMGFKGGKGLAALGGVVLAYNHWMFLFMVVFCFGLMLILNYSFALPISAAILFPILSGFYSGSISVAIIAAVGCLLIIFKHRNDIAKAFRGEAEHTNVIGYLKGEKSE